MKTILPYSFALGGHRGLGCTDHRFYAFRDIQNLPVENTVESVVAAFKAGAAYVEIDAVETSDHVGVVIHNVVPDDHFFDLNAKPKTEERLNKLMYDSVKNFKTGASGTGMLARMDDMLMAIAQHDPKTLPWVVNIEIKGVQGGCEQDFEENGWLERLADTVKKSNIPVERVLFSSFSEENIIRMSHLLPQAQYGMLFAERSESRPIYADHQGDMLYRSLPFDAGHIALVHDNWNEKAHPDAVLGFVHPETKTITDEKIDILAERSIALNSWGLFEKPTDETWARYRHLIVETARRGVPYTAITDYIPEMQKLTIA